MLDVLRQGGGSIGIRRWILLVLTIFILTVFVSQFLVFQFVPNVKATLTTNSPSSQSGAWSNPTYAYADDTNFASYATTGGQHKYGGYGFAIDIATITQVRVRLDAKAAAATNPDQIKLEVSTDGGSTFLSTTYTSTTLTTSESTIWVDVTSWTTWTTSLINNDKIWTRVTQVKSGAQDTTYLDWIPVEVTYTLDNYPTNGVPSNTNWDDTDNCYGQRQWYQAVVVYTDLDGYADFTYVELYIQTGSSVVRAQFRYTEDTNTASIQAGGTQWDFDTTASNFVRSGNTITATWKFKPHWDATEESDLDFKLYSIDSKTASDTDVSDQNFDVVTNLLVSTIECTNTNNPDRININTATQIDVTVRYANDPASSVPTTFYPPDAEFTSIAIHDSSHNLKGTDTSIVNGVGNVAITSETTVQSMNYHAYIDMADADYTDGDESPTETIISDRLQVQNYPVSDNRANINDNVNIDILLWFDYDNTQCTTGTITINGYSASHQGVGVYRITKTSASVTSVTYNTVACSAESTYGITTVDQNSQSVAVIWDRIRIDSLGSLDGRIDVSTQGTYYSTASLEYDNHALGSGDSLTLGGYAFSWVAVNSRFEYSTTQSSVTAITINSFTSGNEATYGITVGDINSKTATIIWDRIRIDTLNAVSSSIPINTEGEWYATASLEYDNHALGSGDSLTLSGYLFTWDDTHGRFEHKRTETSPIIITINSFTSGNEETYGITVGNINGHSQSIEWYAVGYNLNLHVMDWDLTDAISSAIVYKDTDIQISSSLGWANWTLVSGTVQIKVKYFGFWVNGTFSVTMDSEKTIDVKCRLYDVTITVQESIQSAYLVGANVTVFNSTSTYGNRIKTGITGNNGQVALTNLPNNTLTFTQYAGSSFTIIIGNTTQAVTTENQSITLTANQNYVGITSPYQIIGVVSLVISFIPLKRHSIKKCLKRKRKIERGEKEWRKQV